MTTRPELSLGEFVKHLAALLHKDKVTMPLEDERRWHLVFYALKHARNLPEKPAFLEELMFDWDGPYPKARELSQFLQALHWTGNVSAINPQFRQMTLPNDVAELWLKRLETADSQTKKLLELAVQYAKEQFAEPIEITEPINDI